MTDSHGLPNSGAGRGPHGGMEDGFATGHGAGLGPRDEQSGAAGGAVQDRTGKSLTRRTAMVIDDERVDQMMYRRVLERSGLIDDVYAFQYGGDALDFLERTDRPAIDVIFLDINMPNMTGFEFLDAAVDRIGDGFAGAVVIMLTTSLDPRDREKAASYDVIKNYLNKPLELEDVRSVVSMLTNPHPG